MQILEYDTTDANSDWKIKAFTKPSTWTHRYYLQWSSAVYKNYIFIFGGVEGSIFWFDVTEDPGKVKKGDQQSEIFKALKMRASYSF